MSEINEQLLAEKMDKMYDDLETMDRTEMMEKLRAMGCTWSYDEIVNELEKNWNDLKVSDKIFETCTIDDTCSIYPRDFIDEAIYLILSRFHQFKFEHYGLISKRLDDLCEAEMKDTEKISEFEECFKRFFKMCKMFDLNNFDAIGYEVNDGLDLHSIIIDYLDECMEQGSTNDPAYYNKIIDFVLRFQKQFKYVNDFLSDALKVELATVYVATKNPKGEKMFLDAINTKTDKTEAVLHYGLAYLDQFPQKTLRIFERYKTLINKESDAYEIIKEIIDDSKKQA